ncbi:MAG TPA: CPBP family intramembrane glutamic endopeptidase, partial [Propionibacteriaceae bacterium]|nr:CPBP family intramembrane glutamic endopeptidase [Propionibacteriaceae bacterium]
VAQLNTSIADGKMSARPADRSRWIGVIRAHPLRAYFLITYLVTWSYWPVVYGLAGKASRLWAAPGVFVPALAAVLVTALLGGRPGLRAFLRGWIRWRVSARWYVFALLVLPALVLLSYVFLPGGTKGLEGGAFIVGLTYAAMFVAHLPIGGGQEAGWRGFALPRLQERFGPLRASLVVGALWGMCDLPLWVFIPNHTNAGYGVGQIATAFIVSVGGYTVGLSLILAWLFNRTNGSVLLATLAHTSVISLAFTQTTRASTLTSFLAILAIGLVIAVTTGGRLGYRRAIGSWY